MKACAPGVGDARGEVRIGRIEIDLDQARVAHRLDRQAPSTGSTSARSLGLRLARGRGAALAFADASSACSIVLERGVADQPQVLDHAQRQRAALQQFVLGLVEVAVHRATRPASAPPTSTTLMVSRSICSVEDARKIGVISSVSTSASSKHRAGDAGDHPFAVAQDLASTRAG